MRKSYFFFLRIEPLCCLCQPWCDPVLFRGFAIQLSTTLPLYRNINLHCLSQHGAVTFVISTDIGSSTGCAMLRLQLFRHYVPVANQSPSPPAPVVSLYGLQGSEKLHLSATLLTPPPTPPSFFLSFPLVSS